MIDQSMKEQLTALFAGLQSDYTFDVSFSEQSATSDELMELLTDVAECSPKISINTNQSPQLGFSILKNGVASGVSFRAIPNGHEFNSLLLAILNLDGKGKNLPDQFTLKRIKSLKGKINLTTYMSLTCTNCPDVVQTLNVVAMLSQGVSHEAVDGAINQQEVEKFNIQSVPTVYADGVLLSVGRTSLSELLDKLEERYGVELSDEVEIREYDLLVAGGGPAGATAAMYSARKGLKVGIIAQKVGGQVNETVAIENIPSVIHTTGSKLAQDLKEQLQHYNIDILENRNIESVELEGTLKRVNVKGGDSYIAPAMIISTGASWRRLGVEGESEYVGRGVAFCPHCDGPFYKGKTVAVIGGGNSGVEAAIDLAGICSRVLLYEFMEELKADSVLQQKLTTLPNVEIYTSSQTMSIDGDGSKVTSITVRNRATDQESIVPLDGIFIQIGLSANSSLFADLVETNRIGEIVVDRNGRTSQKGIYAAGDVTDVSYKQVVISMGEGAKAALAAFDDRIRGEL